MNDDPAVSVSHPIPKIITALAAGLGVSSWSDVAALLATIYTACLLMEWWWKRFWRPFFESHGWLKSRLRRKGDSQRGQARPRMMVALLTVSAAGFVGIALHEGYTDRAVAPVHGDVPTNGFGSTGPDIKLGDRTTPPQALQRALRDVGKSEKAIKGCVVVPLMQYEFDAYTSLSYNIGADAFCHSTLVRKLNTGDYAGACAEISRWDRFQGKPLAGLTVRRAAERQQCEGKS